MRTIASRVSPCLAAVGLLWAGCATNLSTLQTADTVNAPGVRIGGGAGLYVPAGTMMREMDPRVCASALQAEGESGANACLSEEYLELLRAAQDGEAPPLDPDDPEDRERIREMFRHAVALALFPPAPMAEISLRTGVGQNVDIGARWTPLTLRGDAKWRLIGGDEEGSSFSLAVLGGAEYFLYDWLLVDMQEYLQQEYELFHHVTLEDPRRLDVEAMVIASGEIFAIFSPYAAVKYRAGVFDVPLTLHIDHPDYEPITVSDRIRGVVHYAGGTVGMGLGWRWLRVFAEVTAMMAFSQVVVLDEAIDVGGPTVYPALGVAIELP